MKPLNTAADAPWRQRFRVPVTYAWPAQSARTRGMAVSNRSGVFQLYTWDVTTGELRRLTDRPSGQVSGMISGDGRYVYYLNDEQGNELGHYVRVSFAGGAAEDVTLDMPPYASLSCTTNHTGSMLGFTTADSTGFHMHLINIGPGGALGERKQFYETHSFSNIVALSYNGEIVVVNTTEGRDTLEFYLLAFDAASGTPIGALSDGPSSSVRAGTFAALPGDTQLLATSNRTGFVRPLIWDVRSGERIDLNLGDLEGDVEPKDWSADGECIILLHIHQAAHQLYLYHLADGALTRLDHPSGTFGGVYFGPDGDIFAHWEDATHPTQLIVLDGATGAWTRTVIGADETPPCRPWRSVSFPSNDGQIIQGWLALPEGKGPFPTILETHGGPTSVMTEVYHANSQAWLDHGFAFLTINYRGSTTFGRDFEQQIWGNLGQLEVEDMAAARDWLVNEGIADPQGILLTGWSYGGYLTLQALGKRPDLWAGGMAGIAIADWAMQYEDSAETLRGYQLALFGGTPEEKPDVYTAASPITYAAQVAAPILVIQGSNDTRCPARPMRMYEEKMRALGKDIEVVWFEAGHGSYVTEQQIEHQERMLRFAYRVLG
jgi:dipeptidyl aminopeptidase/acylaminoacyl peptidase